MRSTTVDIGGPVHVADFGGSGTPMVLVHGLGGSHANWLAVGPRLAERFAVTAPDLAGFGLTPPAGRSSSVEANAQLLTDYLATLRTPVILAGNSMGGLIAMMVAARRPRLVQALILVDPALPQPLTMRPNLVITAAFAAYAVPGLGEMYVRRRAERLGPEGMVRETIKLCTVDPSRVRQDVYDAHVALARKRSTFPYAMEAYLEAARSLLGVVARRRRFEAMMHSISAPTMLMQGTEDRLVSYAAARQAAAVCPSWRFEVFEDIGHTPQLEAADRFVDTVLDFTEHGVHGEGIGAPAGPAERAV
ncbi:MAG TPA: alpha/beta hydrolase [Candidatus Dormibacteraeota bacterium]|nr:alpha/beta hydrolase [Candidatus Dormibacteraeota bacterium]